MSAIPNQQPPIASTSDLSLPQPNPSPSPVHIAPVVGEAWPIPPPLTTAEYDARWNAKVKAGEKHGYSPHKVYGMKSHFSLATIVVMIVAASLLLALLKALDVEPIASALILASIVTTALGQMFLYGGEEPRRASVIVGALFWGGLTLGAMIFFRRQVFFPLALPATAIAVLVGGLAGYAAGGAVAGVLLLMELVESWLPRRRSVSESDQEAWPPANQSDVTPH